MNKAERTIDSILARLFITTYKIEEKAIARETARRLSLSELHLLREIGVGRSKTMSQVADGLKISVGALTTAVSKLEDKGFVQRRRDLKDKRIVNIELTKRGEKAFEKHETFHENMVGAAIGNLSREEKMVLLKVLRKLEKHFDDEWKKVLGGCQAYRP
jgi:DNA-binding MarR family transcriptional regulator